MSIQPITMIVCNVICHHASQERQDAVTDLVEKQQTLFIDGRVTAPLDFVLVVGGFDSSNTAHLKEIPEKFGENVFCCLPFQFQMSCVVSQSK